MTSSPPAPVRLVSTMMQTPLLISTLLDRGALIQPDNLLITRVTDGYVTLTYRQHQQRSRQLAQALSGSGVVRGDAVATLCWNTNRHLQCYHAIPCMGAVLHTLNIRQAPADLGLVIRTAGDKVIIVDADLLPSLADVRAEDLSSVRLVVVCGLDERAGGWQGSPAHHKLTGRLSPAASLLDYDDFLQPHNGSFAWPTDLDENAPLAACFTSGTTGKPKGVVYSHRSQYLHTIGMVAPGEMNLSGADVLLPVVPYFHANGWGIAYAVLMLGARVVNNGRFTDPESILQMSIDHKVTFSAAVPTIWQTVRGMLQAFPDRYKGKFSVKQVVCGGSSPPCEMMEWYWKEYGTEFVQAWGMTETSPLGTFARQVSKWEHTTWSLERQFANVNMTGLPVPTIELKIVDPENFASTLPWDGEAQGELMARGPHVTGSYLTCDAEAEESAKTKFHQGWLATGDIASIDAGGYMLIRDRSKDVIKSGGEWISSQLLEKHISGLNGLAMVAVVGVPHPKWDERPIVVAVAVGGEGSDSCSARPGLKEVRDFCSKDGAFAGFELPDDVLYWKDIPLTGTGKINKKGIRERLVQEGYLLPKLRQSKL